MNQAVFVANRRMPKMIRCIEKKYKPTLLFSRYKTPNSGTRGLIRFVEHSRYKEPLQFKTARDVDYDRKTNSTVHVHLHKLRQTYSAWQRIYKVPLPKLRRNPN